MYFLTRDSSLNDQHTMHQLTDARVTLPTATCTAESTRVPYLVFRISHFVRISHLLYFQLYPLPATNPIGMHGCDSPPLGVAQLYYLCLMKVHKTVKVLLGVAVLCLLRDGFGT